MRISSIYYLANVHGGWTIDNERTKQRRFGVKFATVRDWTLNSSVSEAPSSMADKTVLKLPVQDLTQEAFKDFGQVTLDWFSFLPLALIWVPTKFACLSKQCCDNPGKVPISTCLNLCRDPCCHARYTLLCSMQCPEIHAKASFTTSTTPISYNKCRNTRTPLHPILSTALLGSGDISELGWQGI